MTRKIANWREIIDDFSEGFLAINMTNKNGLETKNTSLKNKNETGDWHITGVDPKSLIGRELLIFFKEKGFARIYSGKIISIRKNKQQEDEVPRHRIKVDQFKDVGVSEVSFKKFFAETNISASPVCVWFSDEKVARLKESLTGHPEASTSSTQPTRSIDDENQKPAAAEEQEWKKVRARRGQPKFRSALLEAYERRCAVTGSPVEALLEAAHITPHSQESNYSVSNGLLLRADIHTLFDLGLLSVDSEYEIHITKEIEAIEYKSLAGRKINMPQHPHQAPNKESLKIKHLVFLKHAR